MSREKRWDLFIDFATTPLMVMGAWKWILRMLVRRTAWCNVGIFDNSKDAVSLAPLPTIPRALNITLLNESEYCDCTG